MIELDPKSRRTIYEQVVEKMRMLIISGVIAPNEKILSVRDMSKQLTVNPNTIQKAFAELERQGYIYTVSGVGSFASELNDVKPDENLIHSSKLRITDEIKELRALTCDESRTREIVNSVLESVECNYTKVAGNKKGAK